MSDVSQGSGWWLASDGKWYSPELAPGFNAEPEPPGAHAVAPGVESVPAETEVPLSPYGYGQPSGYPPPTDYGYGQPSGYGYGQPSGPPPGYLPPADPGYGYPPGAPQYAYVPVRKTNGLAIASLVVSLVWLGGVGSLLAVIFGFVARSQIKRAADHQQGNGLALAGIILGFIGLATTILFIVIAAVVVHHCDQTGNCTNDTYNFGN